jgi:hypothetical protein
MVLPGCTKKDVMVDFIPTMPPVETEFDEGSFEDSEDEDQAGEETDDVGQEETDENDDAEEEPVVEGNTITKYVKMKEYGDYLNIRDKASTDGKIVGTLVHAEKIEIVSIEDGWARLVMDGKYCYVSANYLVDERPDYLDPPSPTPTEKPAPTDKPTPTTKPTEEPTAEPTTEPTTPPEI